MKSYSGRSHVVTGFVPDFQKKITCRLGTGSYCKAKQKKARHSQQPQLLKGREDMAGKVKGREEGDYCHAVGCSALSLYLKALVRNTEKNWCW